MGFGIQQISPKFTFQETFPCSFLQALIIWQLWGRWWPFWEWLHEVPSHRKVLIKASFQAIIWIVKIWWLKRNRKWGKGEMCKSAINWTTRPTWKYLWKYSLCISSVQYCDTLLHEVRRDLIFVIKKGTTSPSWRIRIKSIDGISGFSKKI